MTKPDETSSLEGVGSTVGLERMFRVEKFDHPDLVGGIVWADCELMWINDRITLAILAEREACATLIESFPFWLGEHAKREIAEAIRMRLSAVPPEPTFKETAK